MTMEVHKAGSVHIYWLGLLFLKSKFHISVTKRSGGDRGSTVVRALRYKSEGRWFDTT